jgi:anti-anti-sigma regulatory factor
VAGREIRGIALNLEQCAWRDATVLQVVVGLLKRVQPLNGGVALICTHDRILKVFRITGLDKYFLMAESELRALTMLSCMRTGHLRPPRNAGEDVARHCDHRE